MFVQLIARAHGVDWTTNILLVQKPRWRHTSPINMARTALVVMIAVSLHAGGSGTACAGQHIAPTRVLHAAPALRTQGALRVRPRHTAAPAPVCCCAASAHMHGSGVRRGDDVLADSRPARVPFCVGAGGHAAACSRAMQLRSICGSTLSRPDGEAAVLRLKGGAKKSKIPDAYAVRALLHVLRASCGCAGQPVRGVAQPLDCPAQARGGHGPGEPGPGRGRARSGTRCCVPQAVHAVDDCGVAAAVLRRHRRSRLRSDH